MTIVTINPPLDVRHDAFHLGFVGSGHALVDKAAQACGLRFKPACRDRDGLRFWLASPDPGADAIVYFAYADGDDGDDKGRADAEQDHRYEGPRLLACVSFRRRLNRHPDKKSDDRQLKSVPADACHGGSIAGGFV